MECEVYNLVAEGSDKYFYSIVRLEEKTYAQRKAERHRNRIGKSVEFAEKAKELKKKVEITKLLWGEKETVCLPLKEEKKN